ncbi:MAG: ATP-binding cassette domain-containing protein [Peptoniphilaceae bacterium]|nr:ATP-binding cassette domain-containing protein [Peptoniphilaceae bacterium]
MIELKNIVKTFRQEDGETHALKGVSLTIADGDIYGIIGMSGAGKSTLVRCINLLERPTSGEVIVDGVNLTDLSETKLRQVRRNMGMIFQGFNLLQQKTCLQNVCFPLELEGISRKKAEARAVELLTLVGLEEKAHAYPSRLSGGQQQRVAIARALATNPKILLCDEATSALDPTTTQQILSLIRQINETTGITAVMITHQMSVVESICRNVAILDQGRLVEEGRVAEVFAHPKTDAAKRLVYSEKAFEGEAEPDGRDYYLRVVFDGAQSTRTPLIACMAREIGIEANIAAASTRSIDEKAYGSLLLTVSGPEQAKRAIEYISRWDQVFVEEVEGDVE